MKTIKALFFTLIIFCSSSLGQLDRPRYVEVSIPSKKEFKPFKFKATAYCLRGKTATGIKTRFGIIAVDPKMIPLKSRVYISARKLSGYFTAQDTGKNIKGNRIDIWMSSCSEARKFGVKNVIVYMRGR